jgi:hypothetical protein
MTLLLGKIMAQVLSILALSTKAMKEGRISVFFRLMFSLMAYYGTEKFIKRLAGKTDVEDAFQRLDMLTKEENLMSAARNLKVTQGVDDKVTTIKKIVSDVDGGVKATKELAHDVRDNVIAIKEDTRNVNDNVKVTKRGAQHSFDLSPRVADLCYCMSKQLWMNCNVCCSLILYHELSRLKHTLTGNQLQEKFRTWLSPPNPSVNHNTACDIQHDGTGTWFTQGNKFEEWKKNGSLLWIRGNRTFLCPCRPFMSIYAFPGFQRGRARVYFRM